MANRLTWCISAVLVLAGATAAFTQSPPDIWSAAGVTGIVDSEGRNLIQSNTTGSISIKSSVVSGTLVVRFPIHTMPSHQAPAGACTQVNTVLRDTGSGARVIVRVMQLGIRSGFEGQLTSIGEIDTDTTPRLSNLNSPTSYAVYRTCLNTPSGVPFDFSFFNYYVEAQLIKTSQSANPGLKSLQICHTDEQCEP